MASVLYTWGTPPGAEGAPRWISAFAGIWGRASTWGLLLLLIYYALNGVSPFLNEPTVMRAVATTSSSGVAFERASKLAIFSVCMLFVTGRRYEVLRLCSQMKLVTSFPLLALALFPVSQSATEASLPPSSCWAEFC